MRRMLAGVSREFLVDCRVLIVYDNENESRPMIAHRRQKDTTEEKNSVLLSFFSFLFEFATAIRPKATTVKA